MEKICLLASTLLLVVSCERSQDRESLVDDDGEETHSMAPATKAPTETPEKTVAPAPAEESSSDSNAAAGKNAAEPAEPPESGGYVKLSDVEVTKLVRPHITGGDVIAHSVFRGKLGPSDRTVVVLTRRGHADGDFRGFALVPDGEKLTRHDFPPLHDSWLGVSLDAVLFEDATADGEPEAIVIATYMSGAGPEAAREFRSVSVVGWQPGTKTFHRIPAAESKLERAENAAHVRRALESAEAPPSSESSAIAEPTRNMFSAATCEVGGENVLETRRPRMMPVRIATGSAGPVIVWQEGNDVFSRLLDGEGRAAGDEVRLEIPRSADRTNPSRRDAGFWLEPVGDGFVVFTLSRAGRGHRFNALALDGRGRPRHDPIFVENPGAPRPEEFHISADASGLVVMRPHGADTAIERFVLGDGGSLTRETIQTFESAGPVAVIAREGLVTYLFARRGSHARRGSTDGVWVWRENGSEHLVMNFPDVRRSLDFRGHRIAPTSVQSASDSSVEGIEMRLLASTSRPESLSLVYEQVEGDRRTSLRADVQVSGGHEGPVRLERGTGLAGFEQRVVGILTEAHGESDSPATIPYTLRFELRDAAHFRIAGPVEIFDGTETSSDVTWTGDSFIVGFADQSPEGWQLTTRRVTCR